MLLINDGNQNEVHKHLQHLLQLLLDTDHFHKLVDSSSKGDTIAAVGALLSENPELYESGILCIAEIFRDNLTLCASLKEETVCWIADYLCTLVEKYGVVLSGRSLFFFYAVTLVNGQPVKQNQKLVINTLVHNERRRTILVNVLSTNSESEAARFFNLSASMTNFRPHGELQYHCNLYHLLAVCCRGKATLQEARCKSLISFKQLVDAITDERTPWAVMLPMLKFCYDAYIDSDVAGETLEHGSYTCVVVAVDALGIFWC